MSARVSGRNLGEKIALLIAKSVELLLVTIVCIGFKGAEVVEGLYYRVCPQDLELPNSHW